MEVVVPDLGDFSDVEVIEVLVEVGDTVKAEDPLIVLETDKATMEVPSSGAGVVKDIKVKTGDRVSGGDAIVTLESVATEEEQGEPERGGDKSSRPAGRSGAEQKNQQADAAHDTEAGKKEQASPAQQRVVVPDLGDFSEVEIIEVVVAEGDAVKVDDPLIVLETDKATMEVPSTHAGIVAQIKVKTGDKVSSGDEIAVLSVEGGGAGPERAAEPTPGVEQETASGGEVAQGESRAGGPVTVVVPALGDFSDVEIIEVLVATGDTVEVDDPLIVLETDKATMEVPSTHAGVIGEVRVKAGDRVSEGDSILELESAGGGEKSREPPPAPAVEEPSREARAAAPAPVTRAGQAPPAHIDERQFSTAHASPSVRKLARELGVDLGAVTGSGRKGRVTADDLKAHVKGIMQGGGAVGRGLPAVPQIDFARFGAIETRPLTRIQKISGPRLQASWVNVPHVTQHDEADITELEKLRQELKGEAKQHDVHLTPLAFILRAVIVALEEFPVFRASLSADGESLIVKKYFHIGFAADTPNGLVVPVVRDADRLNLFGLARALGDLSEKAREGKLSSKEIQGGVFTVSSLGGIGGTFFTPIINAPEVAILGVSRSQLRPVYQDGALVPRSILPLSLSYDHRVIDGATAVRFTTRLAELLGDGRGLLELAP